MNVIPSGQLTSLSVSGTYYFEDCKYAEYTDSLFTRRRVSKAFYRSPKTTFLAYFHFFSGSHQWAYHSNTINPNKDIHALGFELNFQ